MQDDFFEEGEEFGNDKIIKTPLYQKGKEILDLTMRILEVVPDENEYTKEIKGWMLGDAFNLTVKLSGALAVDLYDLKMENAAIIRKSARELVVNCRGLEMVSKNPEEFSDYFNLIREAVEEYRILFAEWVKTFDEWNYLIDRWGLFNPPGVNYDDVDPDDLLPPNDDWLEGM